MIAHGCCTSILRRWIDRRWVDTIGWLASGAILAILPKCPICFAAYVALGTGVGLSITTAWYLRMSLLVVCSGSMIYLSARWLRRCFRRIRLGRSRLGQSRERERAGETRVCT